MPYAEGRTYHDADSHVMETPQWLFSFADAELLPKLKPLALQGVPAAKLELHGEAERAARRSRVPQGR